MNGGFGHLLRQARRSIGLTQEDLAAASGLSVEGISLLERGVRKQPRYSTVSLLVDALGLCEDEAAIFRAAAEPVDDAGSGMDDLPMSARPLASVRTNGTARELPARPTHLLGRDEDLDLLRSLRSQAPDRAIAMVGIGGVGKSALAISFAHEISDEYPDGELYLDLRATDRSEKLTPLAALRALMASIGEDPYSLPLDVERASAAWRTAMAGRRLLLVLDDAADRRQVQPLLPALGSLVLVTSRRDLAAGSADIAQHDVLPLGQNVSRTLLRELAAPHRRSPDGKASETEDFRALADRCHGLPLALRIVAARLASRPHWPARYLLERIDSAGGTLLDFEIGELSLRKTLVSSVEALEVSDDRVDERAFHLFLALGLIPGGPLSLTVIGSLVGLDDHRVDPVVERLTDVRLLEPGAAPGTYVMPNVLRAVAQDLASQRGADFEEDVRGRLVTLFSALAWKTQGLSRPTPTSIDLAAMTAAVPAGWTRERCLDELATHADLWQAMTQSRHFASPSLRRAIARMTMGLITYFIARADTAGWPDQLTAALAGLRDTDRFEAAWLHIDLALALTGNGDQPRAIGIAKQAREFAEQSGDIVCACWARTTEALARSRDGQIARARRDLDEVRAIAVEIEDVRIEANVWRSLTVLEHDHGSLSDAVAAGEKALRLYLRIGAERGIIMARGNLGSVLLDAGHRDTAHALLRQALVDAREIGDRALTTEVLAELGRWYHTCGDRESAVQLLRESLDLVDEDGGRQWEAQIRIRLARALEALGRGQEAADHWAAAAQVHLARGEWKEAEEAARQARPIHSHLPVVTSSTKPAERSSG